jgi:hypothetical protein
VTRRQLEEDRSLAFRYFLQGRPDAPLRLGHVRPALLQFLLDPLLGEPGVGLGRKAVDVGQGSPLHLGADRTLAVGGVGAPMGGGTFGSRIGGLIAGDANMTWDPAVFNADASSAKRGLNVEGPMC